jgi:GNAT superfamily N-acetyltransferase
VSGTRLIGGARPVGESHECSIAEREFALIATTLAQDKERQIGVARYVKESTSGDAEFAIVLSDEWQGRGQGTRLLASLLVAAKSRSVQRLIGMTLSDNDGMLALARKQGFKLAKDPGSATITNLTLDVAAWPCAKDFSSSHS